jgi:hypothetical protein
VVLDPHRGEWVCHVHAPPGPQQREALRVTLCQAMAHPDRYLAAALAEETAEVLAAQLGGPIASGWRLRLCGWPGADAWATDVQTMAQAIDADPDQFARLLR